jgi:hypothetical protein
MLVKAPLSRAFALLPLVSAPLPRKNAKIYSRGLELELNLLHGYPSHIARNQVSRIRVLKLTGRNERGGVNENKSEHAKCVRWQFLVPRQDFCDNNFVVHTSLHLLTFCFRLDFHNQWLSSCKYVALLIDSLSQLPDLTSFLQLPLLDTRPGKLCSDLSLNIIIFIPISLLD